MLFSHNYDHCCFDTTQELLRTSFLSQCDCESLKVREKPLRILKSHKDRWLILGDTIEVTLNNIKVTLVLDNLFSS
jgi:hypothetical protein